jgi:cobalt/nickel transport system permease protein
MLRYVDVVLGQFGRMRRAMESRAYRPRSLRGARPIAAATGALFVRSYERGERVYLAMASRGYTGAMPPGAATTVPAVAWLGAAALLFLTWAVAALAWVLR